METNHTPKCLPMAMGDYGIYKYPSNYLIDTNGKIIEKDIDMEDLEAFLKKRTN